MNNPFSVLGGNNRGSGGFGSLVQQYRQFRQSFTGDPRAEVEKLLQSGQLNQQQLDQVQAMAKQFQGFFQ